MRRTHFFSTLPSLSPPAASLFSRSWLRRTQGGRVYTTAQVRVPAGPRASCSTQAISTIYTGLRTATPSRPGPWKPHNFSLLLCCCYSTQPLQASSSLLCGSHGTTAVAHQALPILTATEGALVCVYVTCVLSSYEIGTKTYQERANELDDAQGGRTRGRYKHVNPHFLGTSRATAQPPYTRQRRQR